MFLIKGFYEWLNEANDNRQSSTTQQKEGLVSLWYITNWSNPINDKNLNDVIKLLKNNMKFLKGESVKAKKEVRHYLNNPNKYKSYKPLLNDTLSQALTIKEKYNIGWSCYRTDIYNDIKDLANRITKLEPNKWNPSDVYLIKDDRLAEIKKIIRELNKKDNINIGELNELFIDDWGSQDKPILGCSLKTEKSTLGKGKSFLKSLSNDALSYNLNTEELEYTSNFLKSNKIIEALRSQIKISLDSSLGVKYKYKPGNSFILGDVLLYKYASLKLLNFIIDELDIDTGDIFLSIAAFSAGLSKVNPTFFKIKGNKTGEKTKPERYISGGGLVLYDDFIEIIDSNSTGEIIIKFKAKLEDEIQDVVLKIMSNGVKDKQVTIKRIS